EGPAGNPIVCDGSLQLLRRCRRYFDREGASFTNGQGKEGRCADGRNAGQRLDSLEESRIEGADVAAGWIRGARQARWNRHDLLRAESGIDRHQSREAPDQETSGNQQNDRQRELRRDERREDAALTAAAAGAAPPFLERVAGIAARRLERRKQPTE